MTTPVSSCKSTAHHIHTVTNDTSPPTQNPDPCLHCLGTNPGSDMATGVLCGWRWSVCYCG